MLFGLISIYKLLSFQLNKKAHELECVLILLINLVIDFELGLVYLIIQSKYREKTFLSFILDGLFMQEVIFSNSQ